MFAAATVIGRNLGGLLRGRPNDDDQDSSDSDNGDGNGLYEPSYADVFVAKAILGRAGTLPLELIDSIIDLAEYWPHTTVQLRPQRPLVVPYRNEYGHQSDDAFLCRTPPLGFCKKPADNTAKPDDYSTGRLRPQPNPDPAHPGHDATCLPATVRSWLPTQQAEPLEHPCRKIVFTLRSHDQGWANNLRDKGSYRGSFTWFDVGLERFGRSTTTTTGSVHENEHASLLIPPDVKLYTVNPPPQRLEEDDDDETEETETGCPGTQRYRDSFPLLPGADCLQKNRVAIGKWTVHKIVWKWTDDVSAASHSGTGTGTGDGDGDGEEHPLEALGRGRETGNGKFVRNLCIGDVITVWAQARFPGWKNVVDSVKVDVYWAV